MSSKLPLNKLLTETQKIIKQTSKSSSPEDVYKQICSSYSQMQLLDRFRFIKELSAMHNYNDQKQQSLIFKQKVSESTRIRRMYSMKESLQPKYRDFFINLGRIPDGVKLIVDLRSDILSIQSHIKKNSNNNIAQQAINLLKPQKVTASNIVESSQNMSKFFGEFNESENINNLFVLNSEIRDLIHIWFAAGFLQLERITWASSCQLLEKISQLESVHPIRSWIDMKRRVGKYRRCYVFIHPCMPNEPVVILHTALTNHISSSIREIVERKQTLLNSLSPDALEDFSQSNMSEDPSTIRAAVFYSISSPHRGLNGVDLGNTLIKRVVGELRAEFPNLQQFSTLSPLGGFRIWLTTQINKYILDEVNFRLTKSANEKPPQISNQSLSFNQFTDFESNSNDASSGLFTPNQTQFLHKYFKTTTLKDMLTSLKLCLNKLDHLNELYNTNITNQSDVYRQDSEVLLANQYSKKEQLFLNWLLRNLAGRYLYYEKHRGLALDPVCHFHLKNGAIIWRINWLADPSPKGIRQSYGVMINYRYYLENTEENSRFYLKNKEIKLSPELQKLLTEDELPEINEI